MTYLNYTDGFVLQEGLSMFQKLYTFFEKFSKFSESKYRYSAKTIINEMNVLIRLIY